MQSSGPSGPNYRQPSIPACCCSFSLLVRDCCYNEVLFTTQDAMPIEFQWPFVVDFEYKTELCGALKDKRNHAHFEGENERSGEDETNFAFRRIPTAERADGRTGGTCFWMPAAIEGGRHRRGFLAKFSLGYDKQAGKNWFRSTSTNGFSAEELLAR